MITEVTRFVSSDGEEHRSRAEAEKHEATSALADHMRGYISLDEISFSDLAEWLLANYDVYPKPKACDDDA